MPNKANNYDGMTDTEIVNQILAWGSIAPDEPNGYDARIQEAKWEVEHIYHIEGFWDVDGEAELQYWQQRFTQEQNAYYDMRHAH